MNPHGFTEKYNEGLPTVKLILATLRAQGAEPVESPLRDEHHGDIKLPLIRSYLEVKADLKSDVTGNCYLELAEIYPNTKKADLIGLLKHSINTHPTIVAHRLGPDGDFLVYDARTMLGFLVQQAMASDIRFLMPITRDYTNKGRLKYKAGVVIKGVHKAAQLQQLPAVLVPVDGIYAAATELAKKRLTARRNGAPDFDEATLIRMFHRICRDLKAYCKDMEVDEFSTYDYAVRHGDFFRTRKSSL